MNRDTLLLYQQFFERNRNLSGKKASVKPKYDLHLTVRVLCREFRLRCDLFSFGVL